MLLLSYSFRQKYIFFETTSLVWRLWAVWRCPFRFTLVEARYSDLTQTETDKLQWQKQEGEQWGCSLLTCYKNNTNVKPVFKTLWHTSLALINLMAEESPQHQGQGTAGELVVPNMLYILWQLVKGFQISSLLLADNKEISSPSPPQHIQNQITSVTATGRKKAKKEKRMSGKKRKREARKKRKGKRRGKGKKKKGKRKKRKRKKRRKNGKIKKG